MIRLCLTESNYFVEAFRFFSIGEDEFGDLSIYGPDGIHFCTRPKVVTTRWPDPATSTVDLGFPRTR